MNVTIFTPFICHEFVYTIDFIVQVRFVEAMRYLTHYYRIFPPLARDIVDKLSYFFGTFLQWLLLNIVAASGDHGDVTFRNVFQSAVDVLVGHARIYKTHSVIVFALLETGTNASDNRTANHSYGYRMGTVVAPGSSFGLRSIWGGLTTDVRGPVRLQWDTGYVSRLMLR